MVADRPHDVWQVLVSSQARTQKLNLPTSSLFSRCPTYIAVLPYHLPDPFGSPPPPLMNQVQLIAGESRKSGIFSVG